MTQSSLSEDLLQSMKFRCIGPPRGGRVVAVAGDPVEPGGGLFRRRGRRPLEDRRRRHNLVPHLRRPLQDLVRRRHCRLQLAPERDLRGHGRIDHPHRRLLRRRRLQVHRRRQHVDAPGAGRHAPHRPRARAPAQPGRRLRRRAGPCLRAATRNAASSARQDGGKTWEKVLLRERQGRRVDLCIDERNPDIVYATFWETYRNFWELVQRRAGQRPVEDRPTAATRGPTSRAIQGLPEGLLGKIGVAASPAKAGRVWAIVEAKDKPGLYRSDDFGETWKLLDRQPRPAPPPLVLHAHLRRPAGRGHALHSQPGHVEVHRRRQTLHEIAHAARRQPRPVD